MPLPKDPILLLSYVNTQLRDNYKNLNAFCEDKEVDEKQLCETLGEINYFYEAEQNQFK